MDSQKFGLNASFVQSLRAQWLQDPASVAEEWRAFFEQDAAQESDPTGSGTGPRNGADATPAGPARHEVFGAGDAAESSQEAKPPKPSWVLGPGDETEILRGVAAKIAENMQASVDVPTAMSTRVLPVKVLEENRRVINNYLLDDARNKASYTHIAAWALVRAAQEIPSMNNGFAVVDGEPTKLVRKNINLGLAIDLPGRGGTRTLVVPNLKAVQDLSFKEFLDAYNALVKKARDGKLGLPDFQGTTLSLTNPGGLGTVQSAPRLMQGQGTIIAMGSIGYPAEYEATSPETLRALGVGKVMTVTSTYDHRVIQGGESGRFLKRVHELLSGEHGFYDELFSSLAIPHHPYRLKPDSAKLMSPTTTDRAMKVSQLIHAYRVRGHMLANCDPLDLKPRAHPELDMDNYGLTIWDLEREFSTLGVLPQMTAGFRTILERLRATYTRRMGCEYMHINDSEERRWVMSRVEGQYDQLSLDDKMVILELLSKSQGFERFLHKRYMGHKRFSIEGGESAIPMLAAAFGAAARHGVTDVIIGMAHRGRLNVLANVMGKSYEAIFAEFEDVDVYSIEGSGDVKYHLGARGVWSWKGETNDFGITEEREVRIELACNPSHLEAVNPVVLGQTRARQDLAGDRHRSKIVPLLIHGDAAFAGQGVVFETMQMSNLNGYRVGGCVHLIINNQIGYTTGPERARTALNASDVARAIQAPILRVNGDDPETCVKAMRIAFDYRMRYKKDIVLDMVCYRRHGHNEGDEPSFTQPVLYGAIKNHHPVREKYAALLVRRKDFSQEAVDKVEEQTFAALEQAFGSVKEKGKAAVTEAPHRPGSIDGDAQEEPETAVSEAVLKRIAEAITYDPEVIEIHPRLTKTVLDRRRAMVFDGREKGAPGIDFGMGEMLAYGSLLLEGIPVRISGQDVGRGTFAHRHAVYYDVKDGRPYIPLNYLDHTRDEGEEDWHPSRFRIYDSFLSEEAVLGFEYGYSVTHPESLVIWEAQFGDFFNGAQIQIDQFITSGEAKWAQPTRVVLMLPHGYDGQGPEHSSARIERFLQQCAEDNMRVAIASTAAQEFHLLRRQAHQPKKPLVMFTHKSLLRAEHASSDLDELSNGRFETVLDDVTAAAAKPRRTILCAGKIYWELHLARLRVQKEDSGFGRDVRILRLEQLYPFPSRALASLLEDRDPGELVWVQEEPKNMGAYQFIRDRLEEDGCRVAYIGRRPSASPAAGSSRRHKAQQAAIVDAAFAPGQADTSGVM